MASDFLKKNGDREMRRHDHRRGSLGDEAEYNQGKAQ